MTSIQTDSGGFIFMRRIIASTALFAACVGMILMVSWSREAAWGFWSGAAVGAVNFILMYSDIRGMGDRNAKKAGKFMAGRFFIRYGIMFGYLAVIAVKTEWSVVAAVGGMLSVQAAVMIEMLSRMFNRAGERRI